jgi:hypothetical protein
MKRSRLELCNTAFGPPLRPGSIIAPPEPTRGKWEVILSDDREMAHIRWSLTDARGYYAFIRHYPATNWGLAVIERECRELNEQERTPGSFKFGFKKNDYGQWADNWGVDFPLYQN